MPIELVANEPEPPLSPECMAVLEAFDLRCAIIPPAPYAAGLDVRIFDADGDRVTDVGSDISAPNLRAFLSYGETMHKRGVVLGRDLVANEIRRSLGL